MMSFLRLENEISFTENDINNLIIDCKSFITFGVMYISYIIKINQTLLLIIYLPRGKVHVIPDIPL